MEQFQVRPEDFVVLDEESPQWASMFRRTFVVWTQPSTIIASIEESSSWFRSWWLEPLVATLSFAVWIHFYSYHERRQGLSRVNHFLDWALDFRWGDIYASLVGYWIGVYAFIMLRDSWNNKQNLEHGIPTSLSELSNLVAEVVVGVVFYDALFFCVHMAMHEIPCLKHIHFRHHHVVDHKLEASDVLRHSILDGSLQVLCNILVQERNVWNGSHKTLLARLLHNVVVTWMLTESHAACPSPSFWRRWCKGVRLHRSHHLGTKNKKYPRYQQFFGYLDDAREHFSMIMSSNN